MSDELSMTPMMIQYRGIKEKYKSEVVFFRLGDFYEMFDNDAREVSALLNLTLTHRAGQHMCGIPYHAAKLYIARLLRLGKKVVICEQVGEIPKGGKGITERKVVEIITPGTAVEEEYLDGNQANYLAALSITKGTAGFAFIDVSTGNFSATSWQASRMGENFAKELNRASPSEILLPVSLKKNPDIQSTLQGNARISVSYYPDWDFSPELSYSKLLRQFKMANLKAFDLDADSAEVVPAGFLLDYLEKTMSAAIPHVNFINVYSDEQFLMVDDSSRRNLEITENMRDGSTQFSLFECVNFTRTAMGSRLLKNWLLFPLMDCNQIEERQQRISGFFENRPLLDKVKEDLRDILDIERLAGRIAMDKAHAKNLLALASSLRAWNRIKDYLNPYDFSFVSSEKSCEICELLEKSILDNPSTSLTEGGIIRQGWSEELDHWRSIHDNFNQILAAYEAEEKERTGIANLRIKFTNAFGYFIEVSKGKLSSVPSHFIMRRALVNGDRYTTSRLQELEQELNESSSKILELERDLFLEICASLHQYIPYLLQISDEVANTDVACSLALAAIQNDWTRPVVDDSTVFEIKDGRHPVVEKHLPIGEFVSNSASLCAGKGGNPSFALITGPNMAGKSTYLRQNALIGLLAQTGSYVPASYARIGIIDRIFCRVGASDNLAKGESTFLVEMAETANILHCATKKSLVIMDEVGRGTSTEDGLAIARAVSEYLLDSIKCRTFFATHYHELSRMEHPSLVFLCMDVLEQNGSVVFLRKVKPGVTENSYGIHVARLAGLPPAVIDRAGQILAHIQRLAADNPLVLTDIPSGKPDNPPLAAGSPGLFSDEEIIISEILSADVDNLTPISALQSIARWKKTLSGL